MNKCYSAANILLPDFNSKNISAESWAVVACDQFTSEPEYWAETERLVGDSPSTLRVILPEAYLSETDARIGSINSTMEEYLNDVLVCHKDSMIYTERTQSDGSLRRGIVLCVDLECYDFRRGAASLIRATEATVIERIPPRVKIRRDAPIELPHVMLLIDDPHGTVIEPLAKATDTLCPTVAYDTDLMQGGGHIVGRFLSADARNAVESALEALTSPEAMAERYGDPSLAPLLFAVGDGNHSLATAKTIYEELKRTYGEEAKTHPARYALVEVVNIHDSAMQFEPIYRVVFGVDKNKLLLRLNQYISHLKGNMPPQELTVLLEGGESVSVTVPHPEKTLPVATLQDFLDIYKSSHPECELDYIHGEGSVKRLVGKDTVGFIFSGMGKDELFKTVIYDGALPRKTFSMGHAQDKRYYMECRRIVK